MTQEHEGKDNPLDSADDEDSSMLIENLELDPPVQDPAEKEKTPSYDPKELLTFEEVKSLDEKYVLNTYARMPVHFTYGSGEFLYDEKNTRYIDFLSGIAVTALGHTHADLVEALNYQADHVWHTSNMFYNQQQALLARALVEITFPGKVLFINSGTEANEAAFKLMRAWGVQNPPASGNKNRILALKDSFHGRTFGSMSMTGQAKIQDGFGELAEPIDYLEANDVEALEAAFDESVCGIIIEPIQGEGGILPMAPEFMTAARELCDRFDALLVFDEIQTGMGRSGQYFAYQAYGVTPDVLTIAKGLGGGFPIGAMLVAQEYADVLKPGSHGSTFGGNHLACAVGYEVIRLIEAGNILENVQTMSDYLVTLLEHLKKGFPEKIQEIRGLGLLIGIVLKEGVNAREIAARALDKKLLIGRAGENILRLAPPLIVREKTINEAVAILEELIQEL